MIYVEWLRVRGALKWTAIVLGVLFLCTVGLRIYMYTQGDAMSYVRQIQNDSSSKVATTVLPDGTQRTTIDDPRERVHITLDDRGYLGKHIEILQHGSGKNDMPNISMGSMNVQATEAADGNGRKITIDTDEPAPFYFFSACAAVVALIIATVLGAPFAREGDGHLEVALTKPIGRVQLALATVGIDVAGIVASWLLAVVFLIVCESLFQRPYFAFGMQDLLATVLGLLGAFSWYAMLCAATASMRRGYGIVLGLSWPFAAIVVSLGKKDLGSLPLLQAVHAVTHFVSYVIPLTYLHFGPPVMVDGRPEGSLAFSAGIEGPALAALLIAYVLLAVIQWRRVEA